MRTRELGRQGLTTSVLGYGAMRIALGTDTSTDDASIAAIRRAVDDGVALFDTAELYGWGRGERLLGRALAPVRDDVTIATKFGFEPPLEPNSRPDHIRDVVDNSLRHLGVDHIDVLYQHIDDPAVPIEEVVGVMTEYVDAGKVKYLGLSNTNAENIRRAHSVHPISVVQTEYSIFSRESEAVLDLLEELGIGLVAYAPLARGFLTGAVQPRDALAADDFRRRSPWWRPGNFEANLDIVRRLADLAQDRGVTLSQLALAWLVARKPYIVPIPGSGDAERVAQNNASADLELSVDDLARIDRIAPHGGIAD
ncbi:aryl- alcohol dehydrogenase-like predicted oxidoreductase [Gordonia terrae C-6]|uniref:Aryl-alcohol dehydrogenase-like predicted oxidoreductase n=1 Tax=Gordonia terrae C-6 TaxID=1316928 RepID=R7Y8B3_9ACTN|nr:aldo/keto reductase [Gordonia terrae]EON32232.1 aryl- alcohol dehydrogenase-like predicted oxidoreductase [Gordonia terrae C-6]